MYRALVIIFLVICYAVPAQAQDPLSLSNDKTTIRGVSFRFTDSRTFTSEQLEARMSSKAPGALFSWRKRLDFLPFIDKKEYPFLPVELQRDVIRLQRFYQRNGFPDAIVDYPASQYRASDNSIRVIISIAEGPPVTLSELDIDLASPLEPEIETRWNTLVDDFQERIGERFTDLDQVSLESDILELLQNRGHAFTRVESSVEPVNRDLHVSILVHPGPLGIVEKIEIDGNEGISRKVVLRELPFQEGDRYSQKKVSRGQQELFKLGLFRLVLSDLPTQPTDSTVLIRYRIRESKPRFIFGETGFSKESGVAFQGQFRHRNFGGSARQLTAAVSSNTGWLSVPTDNRFAIRSVSSSLSLHQPYLGSTRLSGSVSPFYKWHDDPNLYSRFFETGISTGMVFEFLPFRTISVQHRFSRTVPLLEGSLGERFDVYNLSLLSLTATIGDIDDFLNPRKGFLIHPHIESGGLVGASGIEYLKGRLDLGLYLPIYNRISFTFSMTTGRLLPMGGSRDQVNAETEFRFDPIRFYAGGASDVRGWGLNGLGEQISVVDSVFQKPDGTWSTNGARFEAIGAETKLTTRFELRFPVPGLGPSWSLGTFLDGGVMSSEIRKDANGRPLYTTENQAIFDDSGSISFNKMQFGTGAGIRYRTPVGLVRFDLAYKINPSQTDLRTAEDVWLFQSGITDTLGKEKQIRRFNIHLSIDRTF